MDQETWNQVEDYFCRTLIQPDDVLRAVAEGSQQANLPPVALAQPEAKLLHLLARMIGARRVLEIGTLAGSTAIWLARALPPGGTVVTLEIDPVHADIARANFAKAGLSAKIELRLGPALESLPKLKVEGRGPFDLIFIDADKENNPDYFRWALALSRAGGLIVVDNAVRRGKVIEADNPDTSVQGTRQLIDLIAAESRVSATALQTVGSKGYDGFILALVVG